MTCIIACKDGQSIVMASDSGAMSDNGRVEVREDSKIIIKENMMIGFSGSVRMGQIIRFGLILPKHAYGGAFEYMCTHFIRELRDLMKANGLLHNDPEDEKSPTVPGELLVAFCGQIYHIQRDLQIALTLSDYVAIGSGEQVATGAMYALMETPTVQHLSATDKVEIALKACSKKVAGILPPFNIYKLEKK